MNTVPKGREDERTRGRKDERTRGRKDERTKGREDESSIVRAAEGRGRPSSIRTEETG